jgi:hypothetical protein
MVGHPPRQHIATLAHEGHFWEVYLEVTESPGRPGSSRGRLIFEAADAADGDQPVQTGLIFVEDSPEAVTRRARSLNQHQITGLLRSCLP